MMRLRSSLLRLILLGCASAPLLIGTPMAAAHARAADTSARGMVLNGSRGNAPVPDQMVGLTVIAGGQAQQIASAETDAHGAFVFDHLQPNASATYVVTTDSGGGTFATRELTADELVNQQQTLRIFDTSSSDAHISVALSTMVVSEPNQHTGRISIAENVTITNTDNKAYVATIAPANGQPMNLLRFALPASATNLVLGAGFATGQTVQAPTGFGLATTIPPGRTDFAFAYDLPYNGTTLAIPFKSVYAASQVVALIPVDLHVVAGDYSLRPSIQAAGAQYQMLERLGMASGTTASFQLRELPVPGEAPYLNADSLLGVGIGLVLLMIVVLAVYLRLGRLPIRLSAAGASAVSPVSDGVRDLQRDELLREHIALDQLHAAGKLDETEYRERRGQLRALLRALASAPTINAAPTSNESADQRSDVPQEPAHDAHPSPEQPHAEAGRGSAI